MEAEFIISRIKEGEISLLEDIMIDALSIRNYTDSEMTRMMSRLVITNELVKKSIIYVAKLQNNIVGFWLRELQENLSEGRFFILRNYINKGIGSALWYKMIKTLKDEHGLKYITFISDANAQGFYEKMGAIKIDEMPSDVLIGGNVPIMRYNFR